MKLTTALISMFICLSVYSQNPTGRMYVHLTPTGALPNTLGYIQYPAAQYNLIDVTNLTDMVINNNMLYVADTNVYVYNLLTNIKTDSLSGINAIDLDIWNNYLIVSSSVAPYFKVFDINNNYSLSFSLDTNKVNYKPADIAVLNNKAYLIFGNSLQIIDLLLQDTIATLPTPHPLSWAGYNMFAFEAMGEIYIDVEYATGAPRFSLLKLNEQNQTVDSVFHQEMAYNPWKPVVANSIIYFAYFNSHYDIINDSLVMATWGSSFPIDYDTVSNSVFVYDVVANQLFYSTNGVSSAPYILQSYINKALYLPVLVTSEKEYFAKEPAVMVYPNPVEDDFTIKFEESVDVEKICFYNNCGKLQRGDIIEKTGRCIKLSVSNLPAGIYYLHIISKKGTISKKVTIL